MAANIRTHFDAQASDNTNKLNELLEKIDGLKKQCKEKFVPKKKDLKVFPEKNGKKGKD
jgi:hypothetical protein